MDSEIIIAILFNQKLQRWHPIIFKLWPLPGPPSADTPLRYKSVSHNTAGFATRTDALTDIRDNLLPIMIETNDGVGLATVADIPWDGERMPAIMALLAEAENGITMRDAGDLGHLADAREIANRVIGDRSSPIDENDHCSFIGRQPHLATLPTHHCFDDALDYIESRVKAEPALLRSTALILVHGIAIAPNGPHQGEPYAHAWVEESGECIDSGIIKGQTGISDGQRVWYRVERDEYYASHQVQQTTRYTVREAWAANFTAGHYGPWEPQYAALCGSGRIFGSVEAHITGSFQGRTSF